MIRARAPHLVSSALEIPCPIPRFPIFAPSTHEIFRPRRSNEAPRIRGAPEQRAEPMIEFRQIQPPSEPRVRPLGFTTPGSLELPRSGRERHPKRPIQGTVTHGAR